MAHRYWHVLIIQNSANVAALSRLEMRETIGGPDVAQGQTVISTGSWTTVANLFDGNDATFGFTSAEAHRNFTYSAGVDFGPDEEDWKEIEEIVLRNRGDSAGTQGPTNMVLRYSDNNTDFNDKFMFSCPDWSSTGTVRTFSDSYPFGTDVLNIVTPPTDTGPFAVTLTAGGAATISGGRFMFAGSGSYYRNQSVPSQIYRIPWKCTITIGNLIATDTVFAGVLNIGGGSGDNRMLVSTDSAGNLAVWEGGTIRAQANNALDPSIPITAVLVFDGPQVSLFVNNVPKGSGAFNNNSSTDDLYLGADPADLSNRSMTGGFSILKMTMGAFNPVPYRQRGPLVG